MEQTIILIFGNFFSRQKFQSISILACMATDFHYSNTGFGNKTRPLLPRRLLAYSKDVWQNVQWANNCYSMQCHCCCCCCCCCFWVDHQHLQPQCLFIPGSVKHEVCSPVLLALDSCLWWSHSRHLSIRQPGQRSGKSRDSLEQLQYHDGDAKILSISSITSPTITSAGSICFYSRIIRGWIRREDVLIHIKENSPSCVRVLHKTWNTVISFYSEQKQGLHLKALFYLIILELK